MCSYWSSDSVKRFGKRLTAMLLLVAFFVALLPITFSVRLPKNDKDRTQPFPCQDRPCGCRTAEQCKKKCCCFSHEQKLAWAERHGVDASAFVDTCTVGKSRSPVGKSCCSSRRATEPAKKVLSSKPKSHSLPRHKKFKIVIGVIAQECQGVAQTPLGQPIFLIPSSVSWPLLIEPTGERIVSTHSRLDQPLAEPPIPPPRLFAV
jgi:hypothetical protein